MLFLQSSHIKSSSLIFCFRTPALIVALLETSYAFLELSIPWNYEFDIVLVHVKLKRFLLIITWTDMQLRASRLPFWLRHSSKVSQDWYDELTRYSTSGSYSFSSPLAPSVRVLSHWSYSCWYVSVRSLIVDMYWLKQAEDSSGLLRCISLVALIASSIFKWADTRWGFAAQDLNATKATRTAMKWLCMLLVWRFVRNLVKTRHWPMLIWASKLPHVKW